MCRPLSKSTIRQIHVILSGALKRAVRWRWLATNSIEHAEPPKPTPKPQPPSPAEAARILNAAWEDPDWAVLVWLTMVTGFRRGELCRLRWHDVDLVRASLRVERSVAQLGGDTWEKATKTHQQRRIALDPETVTLLTAHRQRCMDTGPRSLRTPPGSGSTWTPPSRGAGGDPGLEPRMQTAAHG
ncbi:tyrosine-type recombinase/integrase [Pseudonocardia sp. H11422]|uniref:tyrosine-type recombinase/integrase n=1 Tax=Pseudonocardia sp. H11422 TaxID=2835866 RepID=UPI0027E30A11|nr:tyrosine-type recombinase/integrase [Pseudonocardia sp. H11422]